MAKAYHGRCQLPRRWLLTLFLLLQSFFPPLFNDGLIFHFLPPVWFLPDMMRERTHPQFDDLVKRCRNLAAASKKPALTVLGCSFPWRGPFTMWKSEFRKGCSNPSSGSWSTRLCSGLSHVGPGSVMVVVIVADPHSVLTAYFFNCHGANLARIMP